MDTDTDFISLGNDHDPAVIEALSVADRPPSFKRKRTDHEDDSWLLGRADHGRNSSKRPTFEAVLGRKLRATEPPEWMSGRQYSYQASMMRALHEEVIDFVKYVEPPPEEHQARCEVLAEIRETVGEHLGPGATVYIFGSFETQLYLPHGDIDVVIMEQSTVNVKKQLGKLHREMLRDRLYTQAEFIWSARVPIIKVCSRKYGIPIDISMNQATGLSTAEFVKHQMELMPALRPLALVLKMFLYQRDLNEVANGGIGSYTIIVMLCCFLRAHPLVARKEIVAEDNLGVLLMDFLETFGMDINTEQVAITAQGFMEKRMADRYFSRMGESNKFTVVDPLDDTNNLTRGASHTRTIQSAFLSAFETLKRVVMYWTEAVSSNSTDTPPTLLGYILRVNPAVMQRRDRIVRLYRHIQQGGEVPDRNNAGASSSSSYGGNGDASRHSADKPANGSNSEQGHAGSGGTEHRKHHKQRAAKGAKDSAGSAATETKASKKKHQSKKQAAKEKAEAENADKPAVETPPSKRSKKIKKGKKGKKENGDSGPATLQPAKKPKPAKKTKAQRAKATADSMPSPSAADLRTQPNLAVVVPVLPSAAKPAEPAAALLRKRRKVAATSHTHGNLVTASA